MKMFLCIFLSTCFSCAVQAQIKGCTDPQALNYNAAASENDGSCSYPKTSYTQKTVCPKLSDTVAESSGMVFWGHWFWTINDSGNPPCLYAIDSSSGRVLHKTTLAGVQNTDWEELAQDSAFFYIGDFGNNRGGRKDLRILKVKKADIRLSVFEDTVNAAQIRFAMADQINFSNTGQNHDYDLEAFCSIGDSLHLFSKNWVDYKTRHYVCPKDTGFYALLPVETIDIGGQVTGACHRTDGLTVLTGYTKNFQGSFIFLMWDHRNLLYNTGNRRRIEIGNLVVPGQNEAICFKDQVLYMSSEKQVSEAGLYRLHTDTWTGRTLGVNERTMHADGAIRIHHRDKQILLESEPQMMGKLFQIMDSSGRVVLSLQIRQAVETIDTGILPAGIYMVYTDRHFCKKIEIR